MSRWDFSRIQEWAPEDHPKGAVIPEPGTAERYNTGSWRTFKPEIDFNKCTQCLFCFIFCPDSSILVEDGRVTGIDEKHCKGCGICASECPRDAIEMKEE